MASTLADFFQKLHWEEVLPSSQLVVLLRVPDLYSLIGVGELPIPSTTPHPDGVTDAAPTPLTAQDVNRYTERLIAEAVITPPFSDARDDQGKSVYSQHYVHVSELDTTDKNHLSTVLFAKMGLTPGDAAAAESFRADEQRQDDQSVGDGVRVLTQ